MKFSISPTLGISERVRSMSHVYNFGLGQSPFPVIPTMVYRLQKEAHQKDYLAVQGLLELREEIAAFHQRRDGLKIKAQNILIGPGSKELLFSFLFTYPAHVFIPSPCWVTYIPQCNMTGRAYTLIQNSYEHGWKLTADRLESHLKSTVTDKKKVLILNYPNNPVGNTYREEELKAIATVCDTYDTTIISDEIYGLIDHTGSHISSARFSNQAIISSGISKWAGAGGWRLGYMAFPDAHLESLSEMKKMVSETYTSVSAPIQYAAIEAFKASVEVDLYLSKTRRVLSTVAKKVKATFSDLPALKISQMEGGFYFFLDFSAYRESLSRLEIISSTDLAEYLLENYHIAALPGVCFGRDEEELTMRFAYIDFNGAQFISMDPEALSEEFILSNMDNLILGLEKLKSLIVNLKPKSNNR